MLNPAEIVDKDRDAVDLANIVAGRPVQYHSTAWANDRLRDLLDDALIEHSPESVWGSLAPETGAFVADARYARREFIGGVGPMDAAKHYPNR